MITQESIKAKLDELYPSRNSNLFREGRTEAISIVETLMAQGFMDCLKFITEETNKNKINNGK